MASSIAEEIITLQEGIASDATPESIRVDMQIDLNKLLEQETKKQKKERLDLMRKRRMTEAKIKIFQKGEEEAKKLAAMKKTPKMSLSDKKKFDCEEAERKWKERIASSKIASKKKKQESKRTFSQLYSNKAEQLAHWASQSKKFKGLTASERNALKNDLVKHYMSAKKVYSKYQK